MTKGGFVLQSVGEERQALDFFSWNESGCGLKGQCFFPHSNSMASILAHLVLSWSDAILFVPPVFLPSVVFCEQGLHTKADLNCPEKEFIFGMSSSSKIKQKVSSRTNENVIPNI
ncbi:hypothetical protein QQP08_026945 [Theobroma cacao]|nr:hypothetical protein QQP08_025075 [Theobroma cacao]WRX34458.1 hypothetical protein QQP08_026945 [Theobroma cacao]